MKIWSFTLKLYLKDQHKIPRQSLDEVTLMNTERICERTFLKMILLLCTLNFTSVTEVAGGEAGICRVGR